MRQGYEAPRYLRVVHYVNSLLDLIGNTPLVQLNRTTDGATPPGAREGGVPQPGRLREGPDRDPDDRGRRGVRRAQAGRHDRRAHLGQHRRRARDGRPGQRATAASSSAPTRSARTSATCSRRTAPRWSSARPRSHRSTRTPTTTSPTGSSREIEGAWKPDQYSNPNNPRSHYETTGPEIWKQTDGRITHFVAGVGTGGTISGIGRYLKEQNPDVQVVGADPAGSVYSGGTGRPYLVEGVGEDFWPETYDRDIADRIIEVSDADSFEITRRLAREEALLVGGSSGMAAFAAVQLAHELDASGGADAVIVVLLPDSGRGYLAKVFNDDWLAQYGFLHRHRRRTVHRRGAARQERRHPRPRAHPPQRDDRRGGAHPPGVRRLADARGARRAADRWPPRWPAPSPSGCCSTRCTPARPSSPTRSRRTWSAPLPDGRRDGPRRGGRRGAGARRRPARAGGRPTRRCAHPAGPARLPGPGLSVEAQAPTDRPEIGSPPGHPGRLTVPARMRARTLTTDRDRTMARGQPPQLLPQGGVRRLSTETVRWWGGAPTAPPPIVLG